jgi:hypothetical protein
MAIETFVLPWHPGLCPSVEEIGVKFLAKFFIFVSGPNVQKSMSMRPGLREGGP